MQQRHGRVAWLEHNGPRVHMAQRFWTEFYAYELQPLHHAPLGHLGLLYHQGEKFANLFLALGAFAPSRWLPYFSCDVDRFAERAKALGMARDGEVQENPGWSRRFGARDPEGTPFTAIELENGDAKRNWRGGEILTAELWSKDAERCATFYSDVLDLELEKTERGFALIEKNPPSGESPERLYVRQNPFEVPPMPWIPYFLSSGTVADQRRAELFGASPQVKREAGEELPGLVLMADPSGAIFGLVEMRRSS